MKKGIISRNSKLVFFLLFSFKRASFGHTSMYTLNEVQTDLIVRRYNSFQQTVMILLKTFGVFSLFICRYLSNTYT